MPELSGTGVWSGSLRFGDPGASAEAAAELETLGYRAAWIPDLGGDLLTPLGNLLGATKSLTVATGVLNLWMHSAQETAEMYTQLVGRHGERVLLGIGVSHGPLIDDLHAAGTYAKPLARTRAYLDELDACASPLPESARVLAALGPKMLELARTRAAGAHPYLVTPEHTAVARAALGPGRILAPEQAVVLDVDPGSARAAARRHIANYLGLPNYTNNWMRFGFTEDDLRDGGSDRLVDALVVWGDEATTAQRVREHRDAGADHVCIQVVTDGDPLGMRELRALAQPLND